MCDLLSCDVGCGVLADLESLNRHVEHVLDAVLALPSFSPELLRFSLGTGKAFSVAEFDVA